MIQFLLTQIAKIKAQISGINSHLTSKINISGQYEGNIIVIALSVSFINGVGTVDMSSYIPSGYKLSFAMACPSDTSTLYITGSGVNSKTEMYIRCGTSYTGTTVMNILVVIRKS